jgi:hypothetical protein
MRNLSVCVILKDENRYILEWLAYHINLGVNRFYIYDNGSNDGSWESIEKLSNVLNIKHINWVSIEGKSPQLTAYMDCIINNNWNNNDYLALIDVDEFLYFGPNVLADSFLNKFDVNVNAIALNQRIFGSGGKLTYTEKPVIERFTLSSFSQYKENEWFKSIVKPEKVIGFNNSHAAIINGGIYVNASGNPLHNDEVKRGFSDFIDEKARIYHYILKSLEEFEWKKKRGGVSASSHSARMARHDDNYFFGRDEHASKTICDDMLVFLSDLKMKIAEFESILNESR